MESPINRCGTRTIWGWSPASSVRQNARKQTPRRFTAGHRGSLAHPGTHIGFEFRRPHQRLHVLHNVLVDPRAQTWSITPRNTTKPCSAKYACCSASVAFSDWCAIGGITGASPQARWFSCRFFSSSRSPFTVILSSPLAVQGFYVVVLFHSSTFVHTYCSCFSDASQRLRKQPSSHSSMAPSSVS